MNAKLPVSLFKLFAAQLLPQRRSAFVITSRGRHATAARQQQRRLHQRLTLLNATLTTCRRSPHTPLADTSRRHKKSTKQTPAHAAASNFGCIPLLASLSMRCWHIIAAAALSSTQQTHDALRGALRGALGLLRAALMVSRSPSFHPALDATRANTIGQS